MVNANSTTSGAGTVTRHAAVRGALLLALACLCPVARAQSGEAERLRIANERAAVQADYEAQAADCRRRFVVTACLDAAQRQRRDALDGLRRQQVVLDESERRQRAADRLAAIGAKQEAASASVSARRKPEAAEPPTTMRLRHGAPDGRAHVAGDATPASAPRAAPVHADVGSPVGTSDAPVAAKPPRAEPRRGEREWQRAAAERARLERQREQKLRLSEMAEHRQAVEQRNADRARSQKPPAAPLPVPSTASAAGR